MALIFNCLDGSHEYNDWYILLKHSPTIKTMILFDLQWTEPSEYEDIIIEVTKRLIACTFNRNFNLKCSIKVLEDFMDMLRNKDFTN